MDMDSRLEFKWPLQMQNLLLAREIRWNTKVLYYMLCEALNSAILFSSAVLDD